MIMRRGQLTSGIDSTLALSDSSGRIPRARHHRGTMYPRQCLVTMAEYRGVHGTVLRSAHAPFRQTSIFVTGCTSQRVAR